MPASISPERLSIINGTCAARMTIDLVPADVETGTLDLAALDAALGDEVACVYFENPGFLGQLEPDSAAICERAHAHGALAVVGVDAISLGVLEAPPRYGADLVCGELQGAGIHMHYGGGTIGFIASADDERIVAEYPTFLIGAGRTVADEWGFGEVRWDRMAYVQRGEATDFTGTTQNLWAIGVAVYLALLGPDGLRELGTTIMQRSQYAAQRLGTIPGVAQPCAQRAVLQGVRDRPERHRPHRRRRQPGAARRPACTGRSTCPGHFPALGQSALVCVTEVHTKDDIDLLADTVAAAVEGAAR